MDTPKVLRIAAGITAFIIVLAAWNASRGGDDGDGKPAKKSGKAQAPIKGPKVYVNVAYSPEKEKLFEDAFSEFNLEHHKVDGKTIVVRGEVVSSGASYNRLKEGDLKPTIWSPSSSFWGRMLSHDANVEWVPDNPESFARTPLVIAMWELQAKALGWPKKKLGWADLAREAKSEEGFNAYGHPEWGTFRLGQTNPEFSTSGLSAIAAQYYSASGKAEGLTRGDISSAKARQHVRDIQSAAVHYGDTTLFFAEQLAQYGPAYASAVAMEEATLVDYNTVKRPKDGQKLVAIYPKEGTFFSDNPLMVLEKAPWVSKSEGKAARKLVEYLLDESLQEKLGDGGFRPSLKGADTGDVLVKANGVDLDEPKQLLSLPSPEVLATIREQWVEDRKPADVAIVLDVSGSMYDENRLIEAQKGLEVLIEKFGPRDRASLITFSDRPEVVRPLAVMNAGERKELKTTVDGLFAEGATSFFDATRQGVDLLEREGDASHIRAVVVLTDGLDNRSDLTLDKLVESFGNTEQGAGSRIRVFTIAYGSEAPQDQLDEIANASGGKPYVGDPENIEQVYTSISSFF